MCWGRGSRSLKTGSQLALRAGSAGVGTACTLDPAVAFGTTCCCRLREHLWGGAQGEGSQQNKTEEKQKTTAEGKEYVPSIYSHLQSPSSNPHCKFNQAANQKHDLQTPIPSIRKQNMHEWV